MLRLAVRRVARRRLMVRLPSYTRFARVYDAAIGKSAFARIQQRFEVIVERYGIRFRSAADIGCGTGLFAAYLSRRWLVPVTAVDRAPEMVRLAARRCAGGTVRVSCQDMRTFTLPRRVDLITANFDTVNHLLTDDDVQRFFRRVADNLTPGGTFIFDIMTNRQPPSVGTFRRRVRAAASTLTQRIEWNPDARFFRSTVVSRQSASPGALTSVESHLERAYDPIAVGRWLRRAGFMLRGIQDEATLGPVRPDSPRVIFVAIKGKT